MRYTHHPEIGNSIEFYYEIEEFNTVKFDRILYFYSGIQGIQLSHDLRSHPHHHSLCDMEFKEFKASGIL
jgi:hypothetical protein